MLLEHLRLIMYTIVQIFISVIIVKEVVMFEFNKKGAHYEIANKPLSLDKYRHIKKCCLIKLQMKLI